ncbi:threonine synthase [Candidatus Heimdallarchaeota archaeon B3_Heim]|nr:MAG: threonine synthase [Candidatus Heimdallarchaeota archaeon B3_Heim]
MMERKFLPEVSTFKCITCKKTYSIASGSIRCSCGGLLEIKHDWTLLSPKKELEYYEHHLSGVWRFKPIIHPSIPDKDIVMRGEGNTGLYNASQRILDYAGCTNLLFKHEGENPTGSFKDRGMTVGISEAKRLGMHTVVCASTGNTSASLAAYASYAGMKATVILPKGKVAFGKLAQALAYGAKVYTVEGTFDLALQQVIDQASKDGRYLLNSINPWRIEGQKTIIFELLENLKWETPDWIVAPAGNLGNTSAFGKALKEAQELELITEIPHLVAVQAKGSEPFVKYWESGKYNPEPNPRTIATAINIGNPVSHSKAFEALKFTNGVATSVSDQSILDAKALIDGAGIGCEPASASTLAGIKKLVDEGTILASEKIVAILTGHLLKDPQIIIDYHQHQLENIQSIYANKINIYDHK